MYLNTNTNTFEKYFKYFFKYIFKIYYYIGKRNKTIYQAVHLVYCYCLSCLVTFSGLDVSIWLLPSVYFWNCQLYHPGWWKLVLIWDSAKSCCKLIECNVPFNHSSAPFSHNHGNVARTHSQAFHSFTEDHLTRSYLNWVLHLSPVSIRLPCTGCTLGSVMFEQSPLWLI